MLTLGPDPCIVIDMTTNTEPRTRPDVIAEAVYYARLLLAALNEVEPEDTEDPMLGVEFGTLRALMDEIADHPAAGLA